VAGWTIQEDTALRRNAQRLEVGGVPKRQFHDISELFKGCLLASDVGVVHGGHIADRGWLGGLSGSVESERQKRISRRLLGLDAQRFLRVDGRVLDFEETITSQFDDFGKVVYFGPDVLPAEGRTEETAVGTRLIFENPKDGGLMNPEGIAFSRQAAELDPG